MPPKAPRAWGTVRASVIKTRLYQPLRSLGGRLAQEMGAGRSSGRPLRGRHYFRIPAPSRSRSFFWRTFGNDWESLDWNYTQIRRAGLSSGGLPNKTGNEEGKASPRR